MTASRTRKERTYYRPMFLDRTGDLRPSVERELESISKSFADLQDYITGQVVGNIPTLPGGGGGTGGTGGTGNPPEIKDITFNGDGTATITYPNPDPNLPPIKKTSTITNLIDEVDKNIQNTQTYKDLVKTVSEAIDKVKNEDYDRAMQIIADFNTFVDQTKIDLKDLVDKDLQFVKDLEDKAKELEAQIQGASESVLNEVRTLDALNAAHLLDEIRNREDMLTFKANQAADDLRKEAEQAAAALLQTNNDLTADLSRNAQAAADAIFNEKTERKADISEVKTIIQTGDLSLANKVEELSAGNGLQFDEKKRWDFTTTVEGWSGNGAPTTVNGWLRPANHATDSNIVSPVLGLKSDDINNVRLRIRKVGYNSDDFGKDVWDGTLYWNLTGTAFDEQHKTQLKTVVFDGNGITTIAFADIPWPANSTINRIRIDLVKKQTATDYVEIDWVSISKPVPGATMAAVRNEETARTTAVAAVARQTTDLAVQMRGDYTGNDLSQLTQGLLHEEREARVTKDNAIVSDVTSLIATVGQNKSDIEKSLKVVSDAQSSTATDLTNLKSQIGDKITATAFQQLQTSVTNLGTDTSTLRTDVNGNKVNIANLDTNIQSLSQSISRLSAGTGEQFDSVAIWAFDTDVEGWSGVGANEDPSHDTNGWIEPKTFSVVSPADLKIDGVTYQYLKFRVEKVGAPAAAVKIWWQTSTAKTWDASRSKNVTGITYDANNYSTIGVNDIGWGKDIYRIRIDVGDATNSTTNYYKIDWVAIGRPTPGVGQAALEELRQATANNLATEVTARETLAGQLRGTYTGSDVNQVSSGLIFSERHLRETAIQSEASARQALETKLGNRIGNVETIANTTSTQTGVNTSAIQRLTATLGDDGSKAALASALNTTNANVSTVTQKVNKAGQDITNIQTHAAGVDTKVADLITTTTSHTQNIDDLKSQINGTPGGTDTGIAGALSGLTTDVTSIQHTLPGLQSSVSAQAQQITDLSAVIGDQFDSFKAWYFDKEREGWTSNQGNPTWSAGWIKPTNHATDMWLASPGSLAIDSTLYNKVKVRVRRTGNPTWTGELRWAAAGSNFDDVHRKTIPAPQWDNNTAIVSFDDINWTGVINQIRFDLTTAQTDTDHIEFDWIAVGRNAPGVGQALFSEKNTALSTQIQQEVTSRQNLAAQMRGTYTGNDINSAQLNSGLIAATKSLIITKTDALAQDVSDLQTKVGDNASAVTTITKAYTDADKALGTRIDGIKTTLDGKADSSQVTTQINTLTNTVNTNKTNTDKAISDNKTAADNSISAINATITTLQTSVKNFTAPAGDNLVPNGNFESYNNNQYVDDVAGKRRLQVFDSTKVDANKNSLVFEGTKSARFVYNAPTTDAYNEVALSNTFRIRSNTPAVTGANPVPALPTVFWAEIYVRKDPAATKNGKLYFGVKGTGIRGGNDDWQGIGIDTSKLNDSYQKFSGFVKMAKTDLALATPMLFFMKSDGSSAGCSVLVDSLYLKDITESASAQTLTDINTKAVSDLSVKVTQAGNNASTALANTTTLTTRMDNLDTNLSTNYATNAAVEGLQTSIDKNASDISNVSSKYTDLSATISGVQDQVSSVGNQGTNFIPNPTFDKSSVSWNLRPDTTKASWNATGGDNISGAAGNQGKSSFKLVTSNTTDDVMISTPLFPAKGGSTFKLVVRAKGTDNGTNKAKMIVNVDEYETYGGTRTTNSYTFLNLDNTQFKDYVIAWGDHDHPTIPLKTGTSFVSISIGHAKVPCTVTISSVYMYDQTAEVLNSGQSTALNLVKADVVKNTNLLATTNQDTTTLKSQMTFSELSNKVTSATIDNLFPDSTFESYGVNNFAGYKTTGIHTTMPNDGQIVSLQQPHSLLCLKLERPVSLPVATDYNLYFGSPFTTVPGDRYTFSVYVRRDPSVTAELERWKFRLGFANFPANSNTGTPSNTYDLPLKTGNTENIPTGWKQLTGTFTVPAGTAKSQIVLSIKQVGGSTALTPTAPRDIIIYVDDIVIKNTTETDALASDLKTTKNTVNVQQQAIDTLNTKTEHYDDNKFVATNNKVTQLDTTVNGLTQTVNSNLTPLKNVIVDATAASLDRNKYYLVTIPMKKENGLRVKFRVVREFGNDGAIPSWASDATNGFSAHLGWAVNPSINGQNNVDRSVEEHNFAKIKADGSPSVAKSPFAKLGQIAATSEEYVYVRGGAKYTFIIPDVSGSYIPSLKTGTYQNLPTGIAWAEENEPETNAQAVDAQASSISALSNRVDNQDAKITSQSTFATQLKNSITNAFADSASNMLMNGDFEDGNSNPSEASNAKFAVDQWDLGDTARVKWNSAEHYSGSKSLELTMSGTTPTISTTVYRSRLNLVKGRSYTISCYMKYSSTGSAGSSNGADFGNHKLRVGDSVGVAGAMELRNEDKTLPRSWVKREYTFTAPRDEVNGSFSIMGLMTGGSLFLDQVMLYDSTAEKLAGDIYDDLNTPKTGFKAVTSSALQGLDSRVTSEGEARAQAVQSLNATISGVSGVANTANSTANTAKSLADTLNTTKGSVYIQSTAPDVSKLTSAQYNQLLWIDTSGTPPKFTPKKWTGSAWQTVTDKAATDAADAAATAQAAVDNLVYKGGNLFPDATFESYADKQQLAGDRFTVTTGQHYLGTRCAMILRPASLATGSNADFNFGPRFKTTPGSWYICEFWAKADATINPNTGGELAIGIQVDDETQPNNKHSWPGTTVHRSQLSTTEWRKFSSVFQIPDVTATANYTSGRIWGSLRGMSVAGEVRVYVDELMIREVTEAQEAALSAASRGYVFVQSAKPSASQWNPPNVAEGAKGLWINTSGANNTPMRYDFAAKDWFAATDKVAKDAKDAVTQAQTDIEELTTTIDSTNEALDRFSSSGLNLFPDGTFETYDPKTTFSVGDVNNPSLAPVAAIETGSGIPYAGSQCLRYHSGSSANDSSITSWVKNRIISNTGRKYYVEYYVKSGETTDLPAGFGINIGLGCFDTSGNSLGIQGIQSGTITTTWSKKTGIVTINAVNGKDVFFITPRIGTIGYDKPNTVSKKILIDNIYIIDVTESEAAKAIANGKATTYIQSNQPSAPGTADRARTLWIDTGHGNTPKRYDGTNWVAVTDNVATQAAADVKIAQKAAEDADAAAQAAHDLADQKGLVYIQTSQPPVPSDANIPKAVWIDTTGGKYVTKQYSKTAPAGWKIVKSAETDEVASEAAAAKKAAEDAAKAAATAQGGVNTAAKVYVQSDEPPKPTTAALAKTTLWIDTDDGNSPKRFAWHGTDTTNANGSWQKVNDPVAAAAKSAADQAAIDARTAHDLANLKGYVFVQGETPSVNLGTGNMATKQAEAKKYLWIKIDSAGVYTPWRYQYLSDTDASQNKWYVAQDSVAKSAAAQATTATQLANAAHTLADSKGYVTVGTSAPSVPANITAAEAAKYLWIRIVMTTGSNPVAQFTPMRYNPASTASNKWEEATDQKALQAAVDAAAAKKTADGVATRVTSVEAAIDTVSTAVATAAIAQAHGFNDQRVRLGTNEASIIDMRDTIATSTGAMAQSISVLEAKTDSQHSATIATIQKVQAGIVDTVNDSIDPIKTQLEGHDGAIQDAKTAIDAAQQSVTDLSDSLKAQWGVKVDTVNGNKVVQGAIQLGVSGSASQFLVQADQFAIYNKVGNNKVSPFIVNGANTYIRNVIIDNASIQDGAINNAKIQNASIDVGKINNLNTTVANIANAQIGNARIRWAQIDGVSIDNAQIRSLHADKITGDVGDAWANIYRADTINTADNQNAIFDLFRIQQQSYVVRVGIIGALQMDDHQGNISVLPKYADNAGQWLRSCKVGQFLMAGFNGGGTGGGSYFQLLMDNTEIYRTGISSGGNGISIPAFSFDLPAGGGLVTIKALIHNSTNGHIDNYFLSRFHVIASRANRTIHTI